MQARLLLITLLALTLPASAQWDLQDSHTTASLRGIHNVGGGVAWASGTNGTVLRTEDGGYVWQTCAIPPGAEHLDFRGIQAFDENTAVVMSSGKGDLSRLYKTTDGCKTWKLLFTNPDKDGFWDAVNFFAPSQDLLGHPFNHKYASGYILGDPVNGAFALFQSTDGGETWSRRLVVKKRTEQENCKVDPFPARPNEAAFAAGNQSVLSFGRPFVGFITGGSIARFAYVDHFDLDFAFCHDSAGFVTLPMAHGDPSAGAFAIASAGNRSYFDFRLMIVGGDYQHPDDTHGNAVFLANREGVHIPFTSYFDVVTPATPPHGYRSAVAYDSKTKTWITVGPNGTDISRDDGKNWTPLKPGPLDQPDADKNWNALSLPFVVGPNGRIGKLRGDALKP
jgi:hypothetical protein